LFPNWATNYPLEGRSTKGGSICYPLSSNLLPSPIWANQQFSQGFNSYPLPPFPQNEGGGLQQQNCFPAKPIHTGYNNFFPHYFRDRAVPTGSFTGAPHAAIFFRKYFSPACLGAFRGRKNSNLPKRNLCPRAIFSPMLKDSFW